MQNMVSLDWKMGHFSKDFVKNYSQRLNSCRWDINSCLRPGTDSAERFSISGADGASCSPFAPAEPQLRACLHPLSQALSSAPVLALTWAGIVGRECIAGGRVLQHDGARHQVRPSVVQLWERAREKSWPSTHSSRVPCSAWGLSLQLHRLVFITTPSISLCPSCMVSPYCHCVFVLSCTSLDDYQ